MEKPSRLGFIVLKKDFTTIKVNEMISCSAYNYLSILTDGAINPDSNPDDNHLFYIKLGGGQRINIIAEMPNLDIRAYDHFLYMNNVPDDEYSVQGGYGNLYFVLSEDPINFMFPKRVPTYCFTVDVNGGGAVAQYWLGFDKRNSAYTLLVPYIPRGYHNIAYWAFSTATNFQIRLLAYPYCFDDLQQQIFSVTSSSSAVVSLTNRLSGRYFLECKNDDVGVKTFKVDLVFGDRSLS